MTTHNSIHTCYIFALILYSYDYAECQEVKAVSFDKQKLVDEYKKEEACHFKPALVDRYEHDQLQQNGTAHFYIEPLKFLE